MRRTTALLLGAALVSAASYGADATTPGAVSAPYPTVTCLAIEWAITGDDNANSVVTVKYRRAGTATWMDAMPLRRVPAGANSLGLGSWTNKHSGSIFDLRPNTTYEIQLTLTDPDGGSTAQTISAATRAVPQAASSARTVSVTTANFATAIANALPNDILLLADGTYPSFTFGKNGTASEPITIRAANPGHAVFNGDIRLDNRQYVFLEGVTVNGGRVRFDGGVGLAIRRCTVNSGAYQFGALVAQNPGITNCYLADNTLNGPYLWQDAQLGAGAPTSGEGIEFTGAGNVICHNYVKGFRDNISMYEGVEAVNQYCNDIIENDLYAGVDDGIEADYCMGNCRILRNRITNCYVGLSSQPCLGGPNYFIRNCMYNVVLMPFKFFNGSVGDVALHNTVVKCGTGMQIGTSDVTRRALFRNNLILGGSGGGTYGGYSNGTGWAADCATLDLPTCDLDYDGFGTIGTSFDAKFGGTHYYSLGTLQAGTSEKHSVLVDMAVFAGSVAFPASGPFPERAAPDLRLKAGASACDTGAVLANINDGFSGAAPDLGAYELGQALPAYGPRPVGIDESTPILTRIAIDPASATLPMSGSQQFTASACDQWGDPLQASFAWATTAGAISQTGLLITGAVPGIFQVAASSGGVSASVVVTVDSSGSGGAQTADSDGDGVTDAQEIADGTDPFDPNSFKLWPMTVVKMSGAVGFASAGKDSCSFSGVFPNLPAGFDPASAAVILDVGGARVSLTLDAKGRAKSAQGSLALRLKPSTRDKATRKVTFLGGDVAYKAKLQAGSWAAVWSDEGIDPGADKNKAPLTLAVRVDLGKSHFGTEAAVSLTSKSGRSGRFKK